MRLIDADALINSLKKDWPQTSKITWAQIVAKCAPTIDTVPVTHGEWKKVKGADGGYTDFRCSNCRRYRFHNGEMLKKYLYCPNCGAKMDGGKE